MSIVKFKTPEDDILLYIQSNYMYDDGILIKNGKRTGHLNTDGYINVHVKGLRYKRSHIVWFLFNDVWPTKNIDHKNGNSQDDRIENLREVSIRENALNRVEHRNGRMKGVSLHKKRLHLDRYWRAQASVNGVRTHIGYYATELEASEAYLLYLKEHNLE